MKKDIYITVTQAGEYSSTIRDWELGKRKINTASELVQLKLDEFTLGRAGFNSKMVV